MKTKIMVSLLLVLIVAISASAVSATEDIADTISETSDSSDIELTNEDATNVDAIAEDSDEEDVIGDDGKNDDKLGDGGVTIDNPISVGSLDKFIEYVGTGKTYSNGTTFVLDNNYIFNLTSPQNLKISCTIKGGTLKAENLDYFYYIESPKNGGPNKVTIKDATFIITKNQSVLFANGEWVGDNYVTSIAGITLENITFQFEEGVDPSTASLLCINDTVINNFSNEINIINNNLNGAKSIIIPQNNQIVEGDVHYDATVITYPIEQKNTQIVLNSNIGDVLPAYVVDTAVGDPAITFQVKLIDENGNAVANKTITFYFNAKEYSAVTNEKGIATLKLNISTAGTDYIYSIFKGDEEYYSSGQVANTIKLTKKISTFVIKNVSYKVTATKKLSVTFKSPNYTYVIKNNTLTRKTTYKLIKNKKVKFTVNGKTYTATTNSKGVATVKITLNKKGTYTYTAKFAGDSKYQAVTKKAKLTVKPLTTSLTTKKYKFKRYKKTKKISTTLKSGKTVLKKQKITFKVNGKTYTAKTNSKGIATVKIKLSKKGTYKYTVKYAGTNKYKAISKTNKVVIVK